MRISHKLLITLISIVTLTLAGFLTVVHLKNQYELRQLSSDFGQSLAEQMAKAAAEPLFAKDLLSLNVIVSQLQSAKHLAYAAIVDTSMKPLAEVGQKPEALDTGFAQVAIRFQANKAGYAIVAMDQGKVSAAVFDTSFMLLALAAIVLVLSAIIISAIVKHVVDGLETTSFAFKELAQGHLGTQINIQRSDELGTLITSFNQMSQGLESREQLYHPNDTKPMASKKLDHLSNGYIHITQMFVDLSEISRHIDKLSEVGCAHLLNTYHQIVNLAAHHYDCDSCRFESEGLSVRFLASDPQEAANACLDAICASQLALRLIDRLNQARYEQSLPTIRVSIAVHHALGFASRITNTGHDYTAFLTQIDTEVCRLSKLTQRGRVALTQAVVELSKAHQVVQTGPLQTQPMTDFHSELKYTLICGLGPQLRKPIQLQADELFEALYPMVTFAPTHDEEQIFPYDSPLESKDYNPA